MNVKNKRKDELFQKLNYKYWRLFLIKEKITNNIYKLKLSSFIKIYSIFNTDRLKLYYENVLTKQETCLEVVKEVKE